MNDTLRTATERGTFAAGCFWGIEASFRQLPGVLDAVSGYTGGHTPDPSYRQVCSGRTGHAEAVEVTYDPARISYAALLDAFWSLHDPTTMNRQGPTSGRSTARRSSRTRPNRAPPRRLRNRARMRAENIAGRS